MVNNNDKQMPKDFDFDKYQSLGLKLVRSLVGQLGGAIKINSVGGSQFVIRFIAS